ncbi:MAG: hypothetical protein NVSMB62_00820 [Acidobacteriaceae bacterium]
MALLFTLIYVAMSLLSPSVLPNEIVALHVNEILGVLAILACIISLGSSGIGRIPDTYLLMGLVVAVTLSIAATGWLGAIPGKLLDYLPVFIVFYFIAIGCRSVFQLKILVYVMLFVALYIFAHGAMADHAGELTSHYLEAEGLAPNIVYRYKGLGVLSDPNDTAQFYATLIPLLFLRWKRGSYFLNFVLTIVPACILAAGMYFTHSRGGAIALVALTLFGFKDKLGFIKSSILAAALFAGMMYINVSGGRGMNEDDGGRVAAWSTGLELFRAHPLVGVGIDKFGDYNDTGHTAHNSYILCLAEVGLIGYTCWIGAIVSNWFGLSLITRTEKKKEKKSTNGLPYSRTLVSEPEPVAVAAEAHRPEFVPATLHAGVLASPPGFARLAYEGGGAGGWTPPLSMQSSSSSMTKRDSDEDLVRAAKVLLVSFVGLLTAAFFLSRSFSMVFYIVLGMSAALRLMYQSKHPAMSVDLRMLGRRIAFVIAGSVVFLYLFVRIRGIH